MAITYPLSLPTSINISSIEIWAVNAVATSMSPFTYKQQVFSHGGQRWEASISIPPVRRDKAAEWTTFLVALKGQEGTFLLGDPDYATPQGTATTCTVTGSIGDDVVSLTTDGTLVAGDYIQIGTASTARLHKVLETISAGTTSVSIWPNLKDDYTSATCTLTNPSGLFRLKQNIGSWQIDNSSAYGLSFEAVEVLI